MVDYTQDEDAFGNLSLDEKWRVTIEAIFTEDLHRIGDPAVVDTFNIPSNIILGRD